MERRRFFESGDLDYLANLCHACGACYHDCQFVPPHEYAVNVPVAMAELRAETYGRYAWPGFLAPVFEKNGLVIALLTALAVAGFIAGFMAWVDPAVLFSAQTGAGSFYRIMPHNAMALLFGAVFLYAMLALWMGLRNFWKETGGGKVTLSAFRAAGQSAGKLKNLDGGGGGCMNTSDKPDDKRRHYHHMTFYGFLLCFASTSVATFQHYFLGMEAPYPWYNPAVVLGSLGGIGLIIGPLGLWKEKQNKLEVIRTATGGMDQAFILMLFLTGLTGMLLLFFRETAAMGMLLAIHLGIVFALFLSFAYGKFVHGIYRFAALVRNEIEAADGH
jgi:citrate/tricarballylate utilization protein